MDDALQSMIEALPDPVVLISAESRLIGMNAGASAFLDTSLVGRHYVTALRQPELIAAIDTTLRAGETRQAVYLARRHGQGQRYQVHCARATYAGAPIAVLTFSDTTEIESIGEMRRDFVANVSHELRTPLTAMSGFIETILHGPGRDDPQGRDRFLTIMEAEIGRMNRLVGDLLSLSRVESSERARPEGEVSLAPLIRSVVHGMQTLAEDAGVRLELDLPAEATPVPGDADQLRQVVTNLLENAIKYGRDGETVEIALAPPAWNTRLRANAVSIRVKDHGPGFDPVHIPRLTERFYRVDSHRSREMGGTGLGLSIVKHIVNRHRGHLRIDSAPGEGAEFTVALPV